MLLGLFETCWCPPFSMRVENTLQKRALPLWLSLWDAGRDNLFVRGISVSCVCKNLSMSSTIGILFSQDKIGWCWAHTNVHYHY